MRPIRNPAKPPLRQRAPRLPGPGRALPRATPSRAIAGPPARPLHTRAPSSALLPGRRPPEAHLGESRTRTPAPPRPQVSGGRAGGGARSRRLRATWMPSAWRGAACTCAPMFHGGSGACVDPLECGATVWAAWVSMGRRQRGPGLGWARRASPPRPGPSAVARCLQPGLGVHGLWEATFALTQATTTSPRKAPAPPRPPPGGGGSGGPVPPGFCARWTPVPRPGPPSPDPSGAPALARPAHSQVAAAGQEQEDLRAAHGQQRAARRQQPHGGPRSPRAGRLGQPRPGSPRPSPRKGSGRGR